MKKDTKNNAAIRFYKDGDAFDIAFVSVKIFEHFKMGLDKLGVPYKEMFGRVVGTASRLHIDGKYISCISSDGDWDLFVKFQGKMELSIEIKKDGRVIVGYPEHATLPPFTAQLVSSAPVQTILQEEIIGQTVPETIKSLKVEWNKYIVQATENLRVGEIRRKVREMIDSTGLEYEIAESGNFPFIETCAHRLSWMEDGRWATEERNSVFIDIEGNHEVSFGAKNRLFQEGIYAEAFRIMEKSLPLVEISYNDDDYDFHFHELFFRLGEIDGHAIFLKIAEAKYER
jgi:hypothetical protein